MNLQGVRRLLTNTGKTMKKNVKVLQKVKEFRYLPRWHLGFS